MEGKEKEENGQLRDDFPLFRYKGNPPNPLPRFEEHKNTSHKGY